MILHVTTLDDTCKVDIKLGFTLVMTHVEPSNDDAHLHNIEWLEKLPLIAPH